MNKAKSFEEAEEFDRNYYAQMTPQQRLSIVQELRGMLLQFPRQSKKVRKLDAHGKGLQRVLKIINSTLAKLGAGANFELAL